MRWYLCFSLSLAVLSQALGQSDDFDFSGGCRLDNNEAVTAEGGCKEVETGLVWGPTMTQPSTYEQAMKYCAGFSNGRWGEWRLPRLKEMARVEAQGIASANLERKKSYDFFWVKDYQSGRVRHVAALLSSDSAERDEGETAATLCVRQGVEKNLGCTVPESEYFITADGGCLFKNTGRVFSRRSPETMSIDRAHRYCGNLVEGGKDDWRLPKLEEIKEVVWAGGADKHFKFNAKGDVWVSSQAESREQHRVPIGMGSVTIQTVHQFVLWMSLSSGTRGQAVSHTTSVPYGGGQPIYTNGPWDAYRENTAHDLSGLLAPVVCVRP